MAEECIGLIPAAGRGLRLGLPYPKELYPIIRENRYKPVAQFALESLTAAEVGHVVFVVNETKHQLIGYFGDGHRFGCHVSYVVQEARAATAASSSPGLAHALAAATHLTRGRTVLFAMADTVMQPRDVMARALAAMRGDDDVMLVLFPTRTPEKFGMVRLGEGDAVVEVVDKPRATDLGAMWGAIVWRPRFTELLDDDVTHRGVADFAQVLNGAIAAGLRVRGIRAEGGAYLDLGTYEEIIELDRRLREA